MNSNSLDSGPNLTYCIGMELPLRLNKMELEKKLRANDTLENPEISCGGVKISGDGFDLKSQLDVIVEGHFFHKTSISVAKERTKSFS